MYALCFTRFYFFRWVLIMKEKPPLQGQQDTRTPALILPLATISYQHPVQIQLKYVPVCTAIARTGRRGPENTQARLIDKAVRDDKSP